VVGERAVLLGNSIGRRARGEEAAGQQHLLLPVRLLRAHSGYAPRFVPVLAQPSRGGDCTRRAGHGQRPHSAQRRCRCGAASAA
jgi:hypothetical protein